ncbi:hypothetical protein HY218_02350 [Candidatus Saccharibacteria bacterium]|nr:hypothetical protein [Candidatus Saccharibacteria bacterium]
MDQLQKLARQVSQFLLMLLIGVSTAAVLASLAIHRFTHFGSGLVTIMVFIMMAIVSLILAQFASHHLLKPLSMLVQAILHVSPNEQSVPAPDVSKLHIGRELVSRLSMQVYQYANQQDGQALAQHRQSIIQAANVVSHLPLPMFVFNKEQIVVNASIAALDYCRVTSAQLFGKPLYETINLEFPSEDTLERWVLDCQKNKITGTAYWQRARVRQPNIELRQCDIAAYYNRDNPSGTEFIVTLFDRTQQYNQDDDGISFVALAVHELRTPLTMLRGYIEVFEDELKAKLDPELTSFMHKMIVSAEQLAAFFNNILNFARVEQNQLNLKLTEANWGDILTAACQELTLKAEIHKRSLQVNIADDLPTVAVDSASITEVINNLIDNAIKYSQPGQTIQIDTHLRKDGYVETTIQDQGVGIPAGVVAHLFDKFYRGHRTAGNVGGTGLGLYLSKAIVNAHGGQIWVQSKEEQGSTFGFSLVPASRLASELKSGDNSGIVRSAHGWIKNHSLYRR